MKLENALIRTPFIGSTPSNLSIRPLVKFISRTLPVLLLGVYGLLAMFIPLIGMAIYRANLEAKGIFLEEGCHGPDVFIGPFTGILLCLFLKIGFLPFFDIDSRKNQ